MELETLSLQNLGITLKKSTKVNHLIEKIKYQWLSEEEKQKKVIDQNIYIIKPGEITNRGRGITIKNQLKDIENIIRFPD